MELRFEFDYNQKAETKNSLLNWKLTWTKRSSMQGIGLIVGFGVLGLSFFFVQSEKGVFDYITFGASTSLFSMVYLYVSMALKARKKLFEQIQTRYKTMSQTKIGLNFLEKYWERLDAECEYKINWSMYHYFRVHKQTLLIHTIHSESALLVLNENEIGQEKFNELVAFLKTLIHQAPN